MGGESPVAKCSLAARIQGRRVGALMSTSQGQSGCEQGVRVPCTSLRCETHSMPPLVKCNSCFPLSLSQTCSTSGLSREARRAGKSYKVPFEHEKKKFLPALQLLPLPLREKYGLARFLEAASPCSNDGCLSSSSWALRIYSSASLEVASGRKTAEFYSC